MGNYAYLADGQGGLRIVDVSTPSIPTEVGFYDSLESAGNVHVSGDYAYLLDGNLRIIDVSIPTAPSEAGFFDVGGNAVSVFVSGNYAYIAEYSEGLSIIDVSTPSMPSEVGFYDLDDAHDVFVSGDYAYLTDMYSNLFILDVSHFTGIEENSPYAKPEALALSAYPNPFNSAVTITIDAPVGEGLVPSLISIEIFDINGRRIDVISSIARNLSESEKDFSPSDRNDSEMSRNNGGNELVWQPDESIGSGIYLLRARVGEKTVAKRVVYLK